MNIEFLEAVFLLSFHFGITQTSSFKWENFWPSVRESAGCDFYGSDIKKLNNTSIEECRYNCQFLKYGNFVCTHYVWNPIKNGTCRIKSGTTSEQMSTPSEPNVKCGFPTIVWKLISDNVWWSYNCKFEGKVSKTLTSTEVVHCGNLCQNHTDCTHFNWLYNITCFLLSGGALKSDAKLVMDLQGKGYTCGILSLPDEGPAVKRKAGFPSRTIEPIEELDQTTPTIASVANDEDCDCLCPN